MKNFKIVKKFVVSFGIVMLMFIMVAGFSLYTLNNSSGGFETFYSGVYQISNRTMEMRVALQAASKSYSNAIVADTAEATEQYITKGDEFIDKLNEDVQYIKDNASTDELLNMNEELNSILVATVDIKSTMLDYARKLDNKNAVDSYFNGYEPKLQEAEQKIIEMDSYTANYADEVFNFNTNSIKIGLTILIVLTILAFAFVIFISIYLTRSIKNPIDNMVNVLKQMAEGSLNADLTYESKDEFGYLADCLRTMQSGLEKLIDDVAYGLHEMAAGNFNVKSKAIDAYIGDYKPLLLALIDINENLSDTISNINEAAEQVNVGSEQVSGGAQALSQGATEQASAIEELTATIEEVYGKIKNNAENALGAGNLSVEAGHGVVNSNEKMQHLTEAMDDITDTSNEIGKIIKTIDDIAFQTNILALNAAVEAARAGEAGKGFAVVADEVRNLAQKSAEAAKNTTVLIENALTAILNGTNLTKETAEYLNEVTGKATELNDKIQEIANASEEQASAVSQITQGVEQISSVVQNNSATAEESAAASEELSGQANMLRELVGKFILKGDESRIVENNVDNTFEEF